MRIGFSSAQSGRERFESGSEKLESRGSWNRSSRMDQEVSEPDELTQNGCQLPRREPCGLQRTSLTSPPVRSQMGASQNAFTFPQKKLHPMLTPSLTNSYICLATPIYTSWVSWHTVAGRGHGHEGRNYINPSMISSNCSDSGEEWLYNTQHISRMEILIKCLCFDSAHIPPCIIVVFTDTTSSHRAAFLFFFFTQQLVPVH